MIRRLLKKVFRGFSITGKNFYIGVDSDSLRYLDCRVSLHWDRIDNCVEWAIPYNNIIELSWNWLPRVDYIYDLYAYTELDAADGVTTFRSTTWTGRVRSIKGISWPFIFYKYLGKGDVVLSRK